MPLEECSVLQRQANRPHGMLCQRKVWAPPELSAVPLSQFRANFLAEEEVGGEASGPDYCIHDLCTMQAHNLTHNHKSQPITVEPHLKNKECELELDTGAALTVLNEET